MSSLNSLRARVAIVLNFHRHLMDIVSTEQPYTILRIKRKRNEEPLDALGKSSSLLWIKVLTDLTVIESGVRRKKSRGGLDIFQFAQTVEDDAWKDAARQKAIQDEISRLSREKSIVEPTPPNISPVKSKSDPNRRYTVVQKNSTAEQLLPTTTALLAKDAPNTQPPTDFQLLDAIRAEPEALSTEDSDMQKIQEMLKDYLQVAELAPPKDVDDSDYVWDVFYRRPVGQPWLGGVIGTLADFPTEVLDDSDSDTEPEDEADEDSNAEDNYKNDYPDSDSDDSFSDGYSDDEGDNGRDSDTEWR